MVEERQREEVGGERMERCVKKGRSKEERGDGRMCKRRQREEGERKERGRREEGERKERKEEKGEEGEERGDV